MQKITLQKNPNIYKKKLYFQLFISKNNKNLLINIEQPQKICYNKGGEAWANKQN